MPRAGTATIDLPPGELHVWRGDLDVSTATAAGLAAILSADERARAARLHHERDRSRFVAGRGVLRQLLARYTGGPPAALTFAYGPSGKPSLPPSAPAFSVSHSGAVILIALSTGAELGVDVELAIRSASETRVPEHFFSEAEVTALRALPEPLQPRAFLECWTRKEAFVKARGDGLSLALDSFTVAFGPDARPALTHTAWSQSEPYSWTLIDVSDPAGAYVAAVAARAGGFTTVRQRAVTITANAEIVSEAVR